MDREPGTSQTPSPTRIPPGRTWLWFAIALILMMVSMLISLRELQFSVGALDLLLVELEEEEKKG